MVNLKLLKGIVSYILHFYPEKIKSGLRVMRPRSWEPPTEYTYEEDEREIGTILQVTKEGLVKVQWDSSDDIQDFKKGPTGQYDLLLFDNAQTGKPFSNYLRLHFVHDVMTLFSYL